MDMQDFVTGCNECDPTSEPERAAELLRAGAELGEAILKKRKADKTDYAAVVDSFNSICGGRLPKVTKLTDKRKRSIKNCLAQGFTVNDLSRAFKAAASTPFLIGKNDRCWTANFDFIIKPDNIVKYLRAHMVVQLLLLPLHLLRKTLSASTLMTLICCWNTL